MNKPSMPARKQDELRGPCFSSRKLADALSTISDVLKL